MNCMKRIMSSMGIHKSISLLHIITILIIFLGIVNSLPRPEESSETEDWSDVAPKQKPKLDAATKEILAEARSIKKPKGYAAVLKKAKKFDKNPQLFKEEIEEVEADPAMAARGYTTDTNKRWKYKMHIYIDKQFNKNQKEEVKSAIYALKKAMKCFDFQIVKKPLPKHVDSLHIKLEHPSIGICASSLGRVGGKQITVVGEKCENFFGVTMHEIMHVLGFFHEHVRKDRDKYVEINWNQLQDPRMAAQYKIQEQQRSVKKYDFDSIMQYPFSQAMQPKVDPPSGADPGQRSHLSKTDIKRLRKVYPCN